MQWRKASEALPEHNAEVYIRYTGEPKIEKLLGWYRGDDCSCCGKHFGAAFFTFTEKFFDKIFWLDESPPTSAVEEAAKMYPDVDESTDYASDDYRLNEVKKFQRQAHIRCAGMYTDTIDKLKAENSKMRLAMEGIRKLTNMLLFGQPTPPEAAEFISDIQVIATEALKTNTR